MHHFVKIYEEFLARNGQCFRNTLPPKDLWHNAPTQSTRVESVLLLGLKATGTELRQRRKADEAAECSEHVQGHVM